MHPNAIMLCIGIIGSIVVYMTWFCLFKGRKINFIKDWLFKEYKESKRIIETGIDK